MVLLYLMKEFFIIGCFSFGGGMAMIPFLQEISSNTGLITETQIIDMITISEITPGPLGVNMATYIGYIISGILGGIITTMALILPQIVFTFLIYKLYSRLKENNTFLIFLKGMRPVALALTLGGSLSIFRATFLKLDNYTGINSILQMFNWQCIFLFTVLTIIMRKIKIPTILYFVACAVIGIVFKLI